MSKISLLKFIIFVVLILPLFYEHFNFLPSSTKYLLDILLFIYFLSYKRLLLYRTFFTRMYSKYIIAICAITIISIIFHSESVIQFLQELRRLVYPFLIYLIVKDVLDSYANSHLSIHRYLLYIFFIQIPITILQVILFPTLRKLHVYTEGGSINLVDIASGTMGAGGTSTLGILIPLLFLYFNDLKIFKYSVLFIIPLIIINSGGGLILGLLILLILALNIVLQGSMILKIRASIGIALFLGTFYYVSNTSLFVQNISRYEKSFLRYNELFIQGGQQTFGGDEIYKIDRFNGYKYFLSRMNDSEIWFGLGFDFIKNGNKPDYQFKSDINQIIAERGFIGLSFIILFVIILVSHISQLTTKMGYDNKSIKVFFFLAFFLGGLYNPTTRSFQLWLFVVYYLALLENKHKYIDLINMVKYGNKRSSNRTE